MRILDKAKSKKQTALSAEELEFLLKLIADSNFAGKDVQTVYNVAVKLQQLLSQ